MILYDSQRETRPLVLVVYKEKFGLYGQEKKKNPGLTPEELALTSAEGISIVVVQGEIFETLDLTSVQALKKFYNLVKNIKLPKKMLKRAKDLNINPLLHVETLAQLRKTILLPNWRDMPQLYDIPSNSQILGQLSYHAGIEAILYPSKMSKNRRCLAIYPKNFSNSDSYIEIVGEIPITVISRRIDASNYLNFF